MLQKVKDYSTSFLTKLRTVNLQHLFAPTTIGSVHLLVYVSLFLSCKIFQFRLKGRLKVLLNCSLLLISVLIITKYELCFAVKIIGVVIGVVPFLKRLLVGSSAPLRVGYSTAEILGYVS